MATILARRHDVEVLTTNAGDYLRWSEAFPVGPCVIDGVPVRRFAVARGRASDWTVTHQLLLAGLDTSSFARLPPSIREAFAARVRGWPDALQEHFIRGQGPIAPGLNSYLRQATYDAALFVTYLYPTTYDGLLAVPRGRAHVVPTLHDEPPAYLPAFGRRLRRATLLCSTNAEVALVSRLYPEHPPTARRIGYGIALPADETDDRPPPRPGFLLYAGRIDTSKGIGDLLEWYRALRSSEADPPGLVLIGEIMTPLPRLPGVEARGFVDDGEKLHLMRRALALVHPSPYESLGIVLLEAMACRTPVIVNAASEVLVEHCRESHAGLWAADAAQFVATVRRLAADSTLRRELGACGRSYVEREYSLASYENRLLAEFPAAEG
jgi:glycosyltransferase involved in cell wall biosynthesis